MNNYKEKRIFLKELGPFKIYGNNLIFARYRAIGGYYTTKDGSNLGTIIPQEITRFDEEGNFLPSSQWVWEKIDNEYWWIVDNSKIKIEVNQ